MINIAVLKLLKGFNKCKLKLLILLYVDTFTKQQIWKRPNRHIFKSKFLFYAEFHAETHSKM
jgi:hypothetical protein